MTADIRGIGFQQGIWRYHPRTKRVRAVRRRGRQHLGRRLRSLRQPVRRRQHGRAAACTTCRARYYVKGFGKHGPLHNPHTYGYFQPVKHHGYVGDSLTGGAIIYQGGAFPDAFNNACIAPNTRHSACRWSTIETRGSTFATRARGRFRHSATTSGSARSI